MQAISARQLLTKDSWKDNMTVRIGDDGRIAEITAGIDPGAYSVGALLPAPSNLHSHAFQKAIAGLTESRSAETGDNFWTWRRLMYRFLQALTPEDIEAIAAFVQMEMLEAGYAAVGEFHYVHNGPDGTPYRNPAELSERIFSAAATTGIGLTHLPVLYMQSGVNGAPLEPEQRRFQLDPDGYERLQNALAGTIRNSPDDYVIGIAPHSLRAVPKQTLSELTEAFAHGPIHIHIAEQTAEVEAIAAAFGATPVAWLCDRVPVDKRWCLVHATHMTTEETAMLAQSGAVAGLCPITEANLGDGIFRAKAFMCANGTFGIGSDSNVRIALCEELRLLEYSQRLRDTQRVMLDVAGKSNGRSLIEAAAQGGAQAAGRDSGTIAQGRFADLVAIDDRAPETLALKGDVLTDAWIFAGDDGLVTDTWSAGRHVVRGGAHIHRPAIAKRFTETIRRLRDSL